MTAARLALTVCLAATALAAAQNPWDRFNLSPASRDVVPVQVYRFSAAAPFDPATAPTGSLPLALNGTASFVLDFGKEVGGNTAIRFGAVSPGVSVGLAYSESTFYVATSDHSNGGHGADGTIATGVVRSGQTWQNSPAHLRGGFRYLRLFVASGGAGSAVVEGVTVHIEAAPNMADLRAYKNHFFSSDSLLNRVWYGCAYTVQLCSIPPAQGRQWPPPASGWNNSVSCGTGSVVLVDGAKRDRMIWPGDMGVSVAAAHTTTGDYEASQNALNTLFQYQEVAGMLPYVGPPIAGESYPHGGNSDTYHLWALIGTSHVHSYLSGTAWIEPLFGKFQLAVNCSIGKIGSKGLMVVDQKADWARGGQGGENLAANCLLHRVLQGAEAIATDLGAASLAAYYHEVAASVKAAVQSVLWVEDKGAFKDNPTTALLPQDGNSLAVWFNVTSGAAVDKRVSDYLNSNWNAVGSRSPEWNNDIGTFPGSMEINAHAAADQPDRVAALARLQWGYMLNLPQSTNSTFWEGYYATGKFAYQGIYMSNSHGWATGAAEALTAGVLGLRAAGKEAWVARIPASLAGLSFCEGSVLLPSGNVRLAWAAGANATLAVTVQARGAGAPDAPTPRGRVQLPLLHGACTVVALSGSVIFDGTATTSSSQVVGSRLEVPSHGATRMQFEIRRAPHC